MPKVTYHFCPTEGRYASRGESEMIYQDNRFVKTVSSSWVPFEVEVDSPIDIFWKKMVVPKQVFDQINSVIRLTRKEFILYKSMKNQQPMTKKQLFELNKSKVSKANIHRALTSSFNNVGIEVTKKTDNMLRLYSITVPKKKVIEKDPNSSIHIKSERDIKIAELRYQNKTLVQIGKRFNISKQRVQQILEEV